MIELMDATTQETLWIAKAHIVAIGPPQAGENPSPATAAKIILTNRDYVIVFGDPRAIAHACFAVEQIV